MPSSIAVCLRTRRFVLIPTDLHLLIDIHAAYFSSFLVTPDGGEHREHRLQLINLLSQFRMNSPPSMASSAHGTPATATPFPFPRRPCSCASEKSSPASPIPQSSRVSSRTALLSITTARSAFGTSIRTRLNLLKLGLVLAWLLDGIRVSPRAMFTWHGRGRPLL